MQGGVKSAFLERESIGTAALRLPEGFRIVHFAARRQIKPSLLLPFKGLSLDLHTLVCQALDNKVSSKNHSVNPGGRGSGVEEVDSHAI